MSIAQWPTHERPREKLLAKGASSLSDAELLAIFIRTGVKGKNAISLAKDLIAQFNDLSSLFHLSQHQITQVHGIGLAKYVQIQAALELATRVLESDMKKDVQLSSSESTRQFLIAKLKLLPNEVFVCLFLDNHHRIIHYEPIFQGTINSASVHPRVVVQRALYHNAAAVIFAHNHPSGISEPSDDDTRITRTLIQALRLIDVRVLDHIIVGGCETTSFAEQGLL